MNSESLVIAFSQNEHSKTVSLSGEIDFAASLDIDPLLSRAVEECDDELILDLENVTFIDSEGIKMFLSAFGKMADKNKRARIVQCSPRLRRVFKLAGVDTLLNVEPDPPDPQAIKTRQQRVQPLYWHK